MQQKNELVTNYLSHRKLAPCLMEATEKHHNFIVSMDIRYGTQSSKVYGSFPTVTDFLQLVDDVPTADRHFYEVIPDDRGRYEYFDIDIDLDIKKIKSKVMVQVKKRNLSQEIIDLFSEELLTFAKSLDNKTVFEEFKRIYKLIFGEKRFASANFLILEASSSEKISLHIVNKSIKFSDQKSTRDQMDYWYKNFEDLLNSNKIDNYDIIFNPDQQVYSKNQTFRMCYSTKIDDANRPFKPVVWHLPSKEAKFEDFLISIPRSVWNGENASEIIRYTAPPVRPNIRLQIVEDSDDDSESEVLFFTPEGFQPKQEKRLIKPIGSILGVQQKKEESQAATRGIAQVRFDAKYNRECIFQMFLKLSETRYIQRDTWVQTIFLFMKLSGIEDASNITSTQRNEIHALSKKAGSFYDESGTDTLISTFRIEKATFTIGSLLSWLKEDIGNIFQSLFGKNDKAEKRTNEEYQKYIELIRFDEDHNDLHAFDIGFGRLVHRIYAKENIISIDKSEYYLFNEQNCLWESVNEDQIFVQLAKIMVPFLKNKKRTVISGLMLDDQKDTDGAVNVSKFFEKKIEYVQTSKNSSSVMKALFPLILDKGGNFVRQKDAMPNLLPLKDNKVIDLRTLEIRERLKTDYFSREIKIAYDKNRKDFSFAQKFFLDLANGDEELARYMKHFCGYCLTGETSQKVMFILSGVGNNGKSLLMNMLHEILGQFSMTSKGEAFLEATNKDPNRTNPELARMYITKPRLLCLPETNKDDKIESKMIKSLTGNDPITFRDLYQSGKSLCEFRPNAKPVVFTNYLPKFNHDDQALVNRIRLIPFNNVFKKSSEFEKLVLEKHIEELFCFICQGAKEVYDDPTVLEPIGAMKTATKDWIKSVNIVQQVLEEICITQKEYDNLNLPKKKLKIKTSELFSVFSEETMRDNERVKKQDFYKRVEDLGFRKYRSDGADCFEGIDLKRNYRLSDPMTLDDDDGTSDLVDDDAHSSKRLRLA